MTNPRQTTPDLDPAWLVGTEGEGAPGSWRTEERAAKRRKAMERWRHVGLPEEVLPEGGRQGKPGTA